MGMPELTLINYCIRQPTVEYPVLISVDEVSGRYCFGTAYPVRQDSNGVYRPQLDYGVNNFHLRLSELTRLMLKHYMRTRSIRYPQLVLAGEKGCLVLPPLHRMDELGFGYLSIKDVHRFPSEPSETSSVENVTD